MTATRPAVVTPHIPSAGADTGHRRGRPNPANLAVSALLVVIGAGALALFLLGYHETEDKTRAALLAGGTALASGFVVLVGGMLTSWRTRQMSDHSSRQARYAEVVSLVNSFDGRRKQAHLWYLRSNEEGLSREDSNERARRGLAALDDAEGMSSEVRGAIAAARVVAHSQVVRACLEDLMNDLDVVPSDPSVEVEELPWRAFDVAIRAELDGWS